MSQKKKDTDQKKMKKQKQKTDKKIIVCFASTAVMDRTETCKTLTVAKLDLRVCLRSQKLALIEQVPSLMWKSASQRAG